MQGKSKEYDFLLELIPNSLLKPEQKGLDGCVKEEYPTYKLRRKSFSLREFYNYKNRTA
jgi:hypothetical protein